MTAFLRTRRLRGGVRHDFNLRDVKEEVVKMGKNQQKPNYAGESWRPTSNENHLNREVIKIRLINPCRI